MRPILHRLICFAALLAVILPSSSVVANLRPTQPTVANVLPTTQYTVYMPLVMLDYIDLPPIIPETTNVLTDTTTQYLVSVSGDGAVFTFAQTTPALEALAPGEVIVSEPTAEAPYGFMRRVTAVIHSGSQVIVQTEAATLEDAIQQGVGQVSYTLTPGNVMTSTLSKGVTQRMRSQIMQQSEFYLNLTDVVLYDDDGDLDTTNDQVVANGSITLEPGFDFRIVVQDWQLKRFDFISRVTDVAELQIATNVELLSMEREVEIARYTFTPITIIIGTFPVVIVPVLTVNVGVNGSVSIGVSTGVTQEATLTAGLKYTNGGWSPVSTFANEFRYNPPTLSTSLNLRGYAGAELSLLIYGVIGPYADTYAYLELEADLLASPWWSLYGGLEVPVGVKVEVLGRTIADHEALAIGYKVLLAQAASRIAFVSDRDGNEEIYWMFSDGTGQENLTRNPANDGHPSWAPSADKLVFHSNRISQDNYEIFTMTLDGSLVTRLTNSPGWDGQPEWSPDGTKIAFESLRTGIFEIFVMNNDGTNVVNLTRGQSGGYPSWSPDGTQIAFHSSRSGNTQIYVMNSDGSGVRQITNHPSENCMPRWSPDGTYIVFSSNRYGNWDIFRVNVDGTNLIQLTNDPHDDWWPVSWSPDGSKIAFTSNRYGAWDIFIMNSDGTGVTRLTSNAEQDWWPAWSPR